MRGLGRGSFSLDGKMIDIPVVVRAEKLLKRFDAIRAREARVEIVTRVVRLERSGRPRTGSGRQGLRTP